MPVRRDRRDVELFARHSDGRSCDPQRGSRRCPEFRSADGSTPFSPPPQSLSLAACSDASTTVQPESPTHSRAASRPTIEEVVPGEVIVKYRDDASAAAVSALRTRFGISTHAGRPRQRVQRRERRTRQRARAGRATRRRSRRRVRGAQLHPPLGRDRSAAVGVPQPGRLEHVVLQRPERAHRSAADDLRVDRSTRTWTTSRDTPRAERT